MCAFASIEDAHQFIGTTIIDLINMEDNTYEKTKSTEFDHYVENEDGDWFGWIIDSIEYYDNN